ncbi:hypothetical protein FOA52_010700 [Chlamydomonas sp. UWO 241]|nr:hypothetical protein FOA52_010700 [Chlamydomonas sp. UWO 241]
MSRQVVRCSVCFEGTSEESPWVALACGHVLHSHCAEYCVEGQRKCPLCRKKASAKDFRIIWLSEVEPTLSPLVMRGGGAADAAADDQGGGSGADVENQHAVTVWMARARTMEERVAEAAQKERELQVQVTQLAEDLKKAKDKAAKTKMKADLDRENFHSIIKRREGEVEEARTQRAADVARVKEELANKDLKLSAAFKDRRSLEQEAELLRNKVAHLQSTLKWSAADFRHQDADVEGLLKSVGDSPEDMTNALARIFIEFKKVKEAGGAAEARAVAQAEAHRAELATLTRELKGKLERAQQESQKRGLQINSLEADLLRSQAPVTGDAWQQLSPSPLACARGGGGGGGGGGGSLAFNYAPPPQHQQRASGGSGSPLVLTDSDSPVGRHGGGAGGSEEAGGWGRGFAGAPGGSKAGAPVRQPAAAAAVLGDVSNRAAGSSGGAQQQQGHSFKGGATRTADKPSHAKQAQAAPKQRPLTGLGTLGALPAAVPSSQGPSFMGKAAGAGPKPGFGGGFGGSSEGPDGRGGMARTLNSHNWPAAAKAVSTSQPVSRKRAADSGAEQSRIESFFVKRPR